MWIFSYVSIYNWKVIYKSQFLNIVSTTEKIGIDIVFYGFFDFQQEVLIVFHGIKVYIPFEQTLEVSGWPELSVSLSWMGFECNDKSLGPGLGDLPLIRPEPSAGPLRMSVIINLDLVDAVWGMTLTSASCTVMPGTVLDTFSPTPNTLNCQKVGFTPQINCNCHQKHCPIMIVTWSFTFGTSQYSLMSRYL